jgi:hypothetical protein
MLRSIHFLDITGFPGLDFLAWFWVWFGPGVFSLAGNTLITMRQSIRSLSITGLPGLDFLAWDRR